MYICIFFTFILIFPLLEDTITYFVSSSLDLNIPGIKSFMYIMEIQQNSRLILSIALKFLYREGVIFSVLKTR